jgi:hypothetical protein
MKTYWRLLPFGVNVARLQERFWVWMAWHLPRVLVKWCFYRVFAHATQGKYADTPAGSITAMDAGECWDRKI